ncbi:MAG: hypothetical protein CSA33_03355 [Desulfobulbus propionicus]|nr:MAG: hypothetical protein CSA33_03355 [Desulfobulbus propionicus]
MHLILSSSRKAPLARTPQEHVVLFEKITQKQVAVMFTSRLIFRQKIHLSTAHRLPSSAVFWQHIYPGRMRNQYLPNLEASDRMKNPDDGSIIAKSLA